MDQSENASVNKVSFLSGKITHFFLLLIVVLLVTLGAMVQSAVSSWIAAKSEQVISIADALNKRVETYRYATWQLYNNITVDPTPLDEKVQEIRLRQDIYYLEKPRVKTEALIFGTHDEETLGMTQQISRFLDILWGGEDNSWSMYYLNGLDNSLILVSTLPLRDISSGFRDSILASIIDSRRAEMLHQANVLDERESFSSLRKLNWQNIHYFTLRTTFNQPGHLATVVAFDLPINNLLPPKMSPDDFQIKSENSVGQLTQTEKDAPRVADTRFSNTRLEINVPIVATPLTLTWQVPYSMLALDVLKKTLLPLLLNSGLLGLAVFGLVAFRRSTTPAIEPANTTDELLTLRVLNDDIITHLPLGFIAWDLEANRTILSNKMADRLLPHLNLQKIISMSKQHQGIIQATVNNELYEILQFRSHITPQTQLFFIRDQDREILVNKRLRQAQNLYEKNQQARVIFMQHIGEALQQPAQNILEFSTAMPEKHRLPFINAVQALIQRVDEIRLLNSVEADNWQRHDSIFVLTSLVDEVIQMMLPLIKRKGLHLVVDNSLTANAERYGDPQTLRHILILLLQYSITTTQIGKITLEISEDKSVTGRLLFRLLDTGSGITDGEVDNLAFPFLNETHQDRYGKANGLTFHLCNRLAAKLDGSLQLKTSQQMGTRYDLRVTMPMVPVSDSSDEKLLDDVVAMLDITSSDIRKIVVRWLENFGANCIIADERTSSEHFDIFLTDNPSNLTAPGLLLSDDEAEIQTIAPGQLRVNFNISSAMQDAVLHLIESQLAIEQASSSSTDKELLQLYTSGYYALFVETVPEDITRLYAELAANNVDALAQVAHRLKGVFAMLNLHPGKQLCETLEHHIRDNNAPEIQKYINDIDTYVKRLLQQGSLLHD